MLDIDFRKSDNLDIRIITLSGEFDLFEKERVLNLLPKVLEGGRGGVLIDLSGVSLLDSAGIEVLIRYYVELKKAGIRFVVVASDNNYLTKKFRKLGIFDNTGLELYESVEEAEKSFRSR